MICDDCGVRPANFLLKAVTDGAVHEKNLCAVCMAKYQRRIPGLDISNLAGILNGILGQKTSQVAEPATDEHDGMVCPHCGISYADFRKSGRLGCSKCYEEFRKPLESLLLKVNGNLQHAGRMPGGLKSEVKIKLDIDRLKQELVKAIAAEEYEQAAVIRDNIRTLSAELEGDI